MNLVVFFNFIVKHFFFFTKITLIMSGRPVRTRRPPQRYEPEEIPEDDFTCSSSDNLEDDDDDEMDLLDRDDHSRTLELDSCHSSSDSESYRPPENHGLSNTLNDNVDDEDEDDDEDDDMDEDELESEHDSKESLSEKDDDISDVVESESDSAVEREIQLDEQTDACATIEAHDRPSRNQVSNSSRVLYL